MLGNRSIYDEAGSRHDAGDTAVELSAEAPPDMITGYNWELYNVARIRRRRTTSPRRCPTSSRRLQDLFYAEAAKTASAARQFHARALEHAAPEPDRGRNEFTYRRRPVFPPAPRRSILDQPYTITAELEVPEGGAEGMIVTEGGRFGGYGLFLSKGEFGFNRGKVVFLYNLLDLKRTIWEGPELEPGKHTIVFDYKVDGPGLGKGGAGILSVDGKEVARNTMEHGTPVTFAEDETFDVGEDTRTRRRATSTIATTCHSSSPARSTS